MATYKDFAISLMRKISAVPLLPFSVKLRLAQTYRPLRFLLPPGRQFLYKCYLGKLKVNIDTTYPIEVEMATGQYDLKTSAVIRRFIRQEDIVIDVGANVGALTLVMAMAAHEGRVFAIEPGPSTFNRLKNNVELNPHLRSIIQLFSIGLSDKPGKLFWQEDPNVPGNAGLLHGSGFQVSVETLDDFVIEHQIERLDFIKIDVEGMEYEVIRGGMAAIAQFRPVLYYETLESFRQERQFDIYKEISTLLDSLDYQHFCISKGGEIAAIENFKVLKSPNTLAIPKEKFVRFF